MAEQKNFILDTNIRMLAQHLQDKQNPTDHEQKLIKKAISLRAEAGYQEWIKNTINLIDNYLQLSTTGNFILKYSKRKEGTGPLETVAMIRERIKKLQDDVERTKEIAAKQAIKKAFLDYKAIIEKVALKFSSEQEVEYTNLVMTMRFENRKGAEELLENAIKSEKPEIVNTLKNFTNHLVFLANEAAKEVEDIALAEIQEMEYELDEAITAEEAEKTEIEDSEITEEEENIQESTDCTKTNNIVLDENDICSINLSGETEGFEP